MADINSVTLSGRLTQEPKLSYSDSGVAVLKFNIGLNKRIKRDNEWTDAVQYFDCVMFSKRAESLSKHLTKGKVVVINGELSYNSWLDKDNNRKSNINILVNNVQLFFTNSKNSKVDNINHIMNGSTKDNEDDFEDDVPF